MNERSDKSRAAVQQIVDRIGSDAAFRQQLVDDPAAALAGLGLGGQEEVSGYLFRMDCTETCGTYPDGGTGNTCNGTCRPDGSTQP
jgi:hypothetical protein